MKERYVLEFPENYSAVAEIRKNVQEEICPDGAYMGADGIFIR